MQDYELMYVLHPRLTTDEVDQAVERISGLITGAGGEIVSLDRWGRRRLAYPIDRNLEGYYVLTTFNAEPATGPTLEGQLNLSEEVLRHLLIRGIIPYEGPPREERSSDRGVAAEASAPTPEDDEAEAEDAPAEAAPAAAVATEATDDGAAAEAAPSEQPEAAASAEEAGEEEE